MVLEFIERDQEPLEDDVQLTASSLSYKNATGFFSHRPIPKRRIKY